jgi:ATP/maltotriose-dependent transcriptional regulator MalT/DNA-binding SARP family transcriptional activator
MNATIKMTLPDGQHRPALGKFTRPQPVGALSRSRLFRALDEARRRPAVWLAGPPGSGKTTLVSTYVRQRRLRTVWYRVQDDDADPATFFHYFGLAVAATPGKRAAALPHLTPEYLLNLPVFSRRFFEEVHRRLRGPCALVLDDYQEVPPDAALHQVIREMLDSLPEEMNLVVLSRTEPPPAFAALRARGSIALLGGDELSLTAAECGEIAQLRGIEIGAPALQQLHQRTQGWTAGVVLALEQKTPVDGDAVLPPGATPQVLFDYFAGDIFGKMPPETQGLLLRASLLPCMAAHRVVQLTGVPHAERVLGELARTNYFTLKMAQVQGAPPAVYQFHPLFREFLLRRAQEALPPAELAGLRQRAAALLAADGEVAEAVALLFAAQAWSDALRVVYAHAQQMLQQGRGRVLEGWLRALPVALLEQTPWALYWLGRCRLGYDPVEARAHLERAFRLFERADGDAAGLFSAWASIVDTYIFEWGEFVSLDRWIDVLDQLLLRHPRLPTPEIETRVAHSMFTALMYRRPDRSDLPAWAERVRSIIVNASDGRTQMLLGDQLMHYYTSWTSDVAAGRLLLDSVRRPRDAADFGPLAHIAWCGMEADHYWHTGAHDECQRRVKEGLETARQFGTQFAGSRLQAHGIAGSLMAGDFTTAEKLLKLAAATISGKRLVYRAHYHFLAFLSAFYQKDAVNAVTSVRVAAALADEAGVPVCQALYRLGLAHALFASGERRTALVQLAQARRIARRMHIFTTEFSCLSTTTYFLLKRGKRKRAVPLLRRTLEIARQRGYVNRPFWTPAFMRELFAAALEFGVEVGYVHDLIRRRKLSPPREALHLEGWPLPVKLYTLGRFSVLLDGKPLKSSGKAQRKPLELLMALIAFGGRDVSERQLTEALWPDAEGDAAHQACAVALHRLRKLLKCDDAISLQRNRLSLDPRHVWVDAWAFERVLGAEPGKVDASAAERAIALYQGPFLGEDADATWALPLRERLRARFVRRLAERGRELLYAGEFEPAIALFEKGLAADPLAEELYRNLMLCYQALDRRAEAIGVYRRCERTLAAALGVSPAPKTTALFQALQG